MNTIEKQIFVYYRTLYDEAHRYLVIRNKFLLLGLIYLMEAIYAKGYCLYFVSFAAVIMQVIAFYCNCKYLNIRSLGIIFQKISMLHNAYGEVPEDFDLSHLKSRVDLKISDKISEIVDNKETDWAGDLYTINDRISPESTLLSMLQENAFWNHHLYLYSRNNLIRNLIFLFLFLVILSLFFMPIVFSNPDPNYSLPRLAFTVLSFTIIYEWIETALNLKKASDEMLEIDNDISRINNNSKHHLFLYLFSKYYIVQNMKIDIPPKIYQKNRKNLNSIWEERINKED